ncbi:MAG: 3-deoxy-D-manno-octulosonic acid transferase [Desulfamplus sp.]|nr:3-deoxy-D-manno-octulosonic acid transferase [Desulfamplus sp.]
MKKSTILFLFLNLYRFLWRLALPILRKDIRLRDSIKERTSSDHFKKADIWIQAASAGESTLAVQLVNNLDFERSISFEKQKQILITSTTSQGLALLSQNLSLPSSSSDISSYYASHDNISKFKSTNITWFPFDIPDLIESIICKVKPALVVLLETELWPSLLFAAKKYGVKVVVINGRMSKRSHRNYMLTRWLWSKIEPHTVLAISDTDAQRFRNIFPCSIIDVMPNMKFDNILTNSDDSNIRILPADIPFSILGSVRKEEEDDVFAIINQILEKFPNQVVGLFPRHLHRINFWKKRLSQTDHKWHLVSEIYDEIYKTKKPIALGTVILWDRFGELKNAYSFATVAFVGGSLKPLGGHNFIEPLTSGAVTVTGPYIDDFAWAGEEIFTQNIVKKADNRDCVADFMVTILKNPPDRKEIIKKSLDYIAKKQGGTSVACNRIKQYLLM